MFFYGHNCKSGTFQTGGVLVWFRHWFQLKARQVHALVCVVAKCGSVGKRLISESANYRLVRNDERLLLCSV